MIIMAERGAHLSQLLLDSSRPSIFELVAQEGLNQALRGTIKFFFRVCANHYPETLGVTFRWANEIQLVFDCLLQSYYLRNHGASFAENFYGLERVTKNDCRLNGKAKLCSLISLSVLPYALLKLDEYFSKRQPSTQQHPVMSFSSIRFIYDLIVLINWMLYTWGKSVTHSPVLHLLGVKLKHGGENSSPGISLTKIIEMSAFFIQFLEWWFTNQSSQAKSMLSLPIPPPPHSVVQNQNSKPRTGACPLCQQQWKNECVLRVSGYVFCYRCILPYLKENSKCPISKLPATPNDLIRIFANAE
ncbi:Peroxisome assembly protein 12 [Daphnia magna]|uniref:Peroxisome assembly protein 12 n=1 Tax=Daphnia magna TaxID=35525 RepID=A0A0N8BBU8_9CRUS|nr:Peroxisome assembly protein 12 [Daphnia magna]SVE80877.1 EOG090X0AIN [Daphnia magna]SVE83226.1 EOG090X0AIN [Daphnia magna]